VKYARAAASLAEWRREGALAPEERPALYRYVQRFHVDGVPNALTRTAVIALLKVEPYEKGVVLPHEQTFPKHKEDRLRILEATRAHLECIFGLYEDPDASLHDLIAGAPVQTDVTVAAAVGSDHLLQPITDPDTVHAIQRKFADKRIWIADGHHRYETALAFRQALGPKEGPVAEDHMMMAFASMSDPGLVLLPTHRIVHGLGFGRDEVTRRLAQEFEIEETHSSRIPELLEIAAGAGRRAFGVAIEGGHGLMLSPRDEQALLNSIPGDDSRELKSLDVTILHSVILERLLGVKGLDDIAYTRDPREALRAADKEAAVSILMNPPSVEDMRTIALGGEKMPQKSTYYFPKILSGLVLWSLGDFEA
jgi:uncharacterized protein (DUF1015 family)